MKETMKRTQGKDDSVETMLLQDRHLVGHLQKISGVKDGNDSTAELETRMRVSSFSHIAAMYND